jgi:hypothetical protein
MDTAIEMKSCGPQLLEEMPSRSWSCERLTKFAQAQHQAITAGDKSLTPIYWQMGMALNLIRKTYARGRWGAWLTSMQIHKTRAAKARAIFMTFPRVEEVKDLSVDEAYAQRRSISAQATKDRKRSPSQKRRETMKQFFTALRREIASRMGEAACACPRDARRYLEELAVLAQQLEQLRDKLQQQADRPSGGKPKPRKAKLDQLPA